MKKRKILVLIMIILAIGLIIKYTYKSSLSSLSQESTGRMSALNDILDVGQDVYVQHDENNQD